MDNRDSKANDKSTTEAFDETLRSLLIAAAGGCKSSFAQLYEQTHRRMFGIVLRIVHHRGEAEEVLQEVYVKVWARSVQFDVGRGHVIFWLAGIAHHAAIDARRRGACRPHECGSDVEDADPYGEVASPHDGPAEVLERSQSHSRVHEQLRSLPADQQQSLAMAFIDGLSHHEIAAKLSCPLGTIKSRVRRALMSMREPLHALQ